MNKISFFIVILISCCFFGCAKQNKSTPDVDDYHYLELRDIEEEIKRLNEDLDRIEQRHKNWQYKRQAI